MAEAYIIREHDVQVPLLAHIPHSVTYIPSDRRPAILLANAELERELLALTDELFAPVVREAGGIAVVYRCSRLVADPERFADDAEEVIHRTLRVAAVDMGVVYTWTAAGAPLRTPPDRPLNRLVWEMQPERLPAGTFTDGTERPGTRRGQMTWAFTPTVPWLVSPPGPVLPVPNVAEGSEAERNHGARLWRPRNSTSSTRPGTVQRCAVGTPRAQRWGARADCSHLRDGDPAAHRGPENSARSAGGGDDQERGRTAGVAAEVK